MARSKSADINFLFPLSYCDLVSTQSQILLWILFFGQPFLFQVLSRRQQLASKAKQDEDMGDEDATIKQGKGKGKGRGRGKGTGKGKGKGRGRNKKTPPEPADVKPPPSRKRKAKSPPTSVEADVSEVSEPEPKAKTSKATSEPSCGSSPAIPKNPKGDKTSKAKAKKTENSEPKGDKTSKAKKKTENSEPKVDKTSKAKKTENSEPGGAPEPEKSLPATWARRRRPQTGPGMLKWDTLRNVFIKDIRPLLTSCISYHEDRVSQNMPHICFNIFHLFLFYPNC